MKIDGIILLSQWLSILLLVSLGVETMRIVGVKGRYVLVSKRCAAGAECPYCHGTFSGVKERNYCCEDAKLWARKQRRAAAARRAGREVGKVGRPRRPTRQSSQGLVYVVRSGELYKIGRTKNNDTLAARLAAFRTANAHDVECVVLLECDNPTETEKRLHQQFDHRRIRREWFALTEADVTTLKTSV